MKSGVSLLSCLAGLVFCASIASAQDAIKIEKAKTVVEYKRFDPANLPDPAPPLGPGEAAVCVYSYELNANGRYSNGGPPIVGDGVTKVEVKIEQMTIKLDLKVTIWLPKNAVKPLEAHEDGHRVIAENFYADAEKVARGLAAKVVGKKVSGEGKDAQAAGQSAMNNACQKLLDDYLEAVNKPCNTAQEAFDRITVHGANQKVTVKDAIDAAMKEGRGKK